MNRVSIELKIKLKSPLHIGSGLAASIQADRLVLRDGKGLPYLPGSSIKGAVRCTAGRLASGLGMKTCLDDPCTGATCLICRLFGSARHEGRFRFGDCRPVTEAKSADADTDYPFDPYRFTVRNGVQICRRRKVATEGLLYKTEFAIPLDDAPFKGRIVGTVDDSNMLELSPAPSLWFLLTSLCRTDRFGGGRSRGAGSATVAIVGLSVGGTNMLEEWKQLSGCSGDYVYALEEEG